MDEYPTPDYIENHEAVLRAFGYWPSFHDAPLHGIRLYTKPVVTIEASVEVFEISSDVDVHGFFRRVNIHTVEFRFSDVQDFEGNFFNVPNTFIEVVFSSPSEFQAKGRFMVRATSVMGGVCYANFSASHGEVISVKPKPSLTEITPPSP